MTGFKLMHAYFCANVHSFIVNTEFVLAVRIAIEKIAIDIQNNLLFVSHQCHILNN